MNLIQVSKFQEEELDKVGKTGKIRGKKIVLPPFFFLNGVSL